MESSGGIVVRALASHQFGPGLIGEPLLTSLFTFLLISIRLPNRSSGRIYELNAKVERAD